MLEVRVTLVELSHLEHCRQHSKPSDFVPPTFSEGRLDGTNYTLWKFKISSILDSYELLKTVLGPDPKPQPTPDLANPTVMVPPNVDLLHAWKCKNADALCALVTSVSDLVPTLIHHTTKASEA